MAQWLERGALPMSLPAVRFRIPIFREISCFSPLNIGTLFRCCVLGHDTLPSHASLDSGVNEYLVGQRWQCVRLVPSAEMAASAVCSKKGVEMVHEWTGPVTRGNMCEAHRALYVRYIRTHHYYYYYLSAGTVFRRQNLTSIDVRFWRLKTISALKE